jgi:4'-phosphopantetheinyl transferase
MVFKNTLPVLSSDIIHVWVADFNKMVPHTEYFFSIMSEDEKKKAADYKFEKDKIRYIISRGVLRELVSNYTDGLPGDVKFFYNKSGKPYISGKNNLKFNLSHSGDFAIYAFASGTEIGIDMEYIRNLENPDSLAKTTLSDIEYKIFKSTPGNGRLGLFFRYWIHKEAFLKADGQGITNSLKNIEFLEGKNGKLYLAEKEDMDLNLNRVFHEIIPEENYRAVLAVPDEKCSFSLYRLEDYCK